MISVRINQVFGQPPKGARLAEDVHLASDRLIPVRVIDRGESRWASEYKIYQAKPRIIEKSDEKEDRQDYEFAEIPYSR